jgi:hypothetical protein
MSTTSKLSEYSFKKNIQLNKNGVIYDCIYVHGNDIAPLFTDPQNLNEDGHIAMTLISMTEGILVITLLNGNNYFWEDYEGDIVEVPE